MPHLLTGVIIRFGVISSCFNSRTVICTIVLLYICNSLHTMTQTKSLNMNLLNFLIVLPFLDNWPIVTNGLPLSSFGHFTKDMATMSIPSVRKIFFYPKIAIFGVNYKSPLPKENVFPSSKKIVQRYVHNNFYLRFYLKHEVDIKYTYKGPNVFSSAGYFVWVMGTLTNW